MRAGYGGSVGNRCRFLFEATAALCDVCGAGRVGVRLSPTTIDPETGRQSQLYFAAGCSDPDEVYAHAVAGMNDHPLAYLLLTEPRWSGRAQPPSFVCSSAAAEKSDCVQAMTGTSRTTRASPSPSRTTSTARSTTAP